MADSATIPDEPERWLPAVGFEGWYEVSSLGRVRSVTRQILVRFTTRAPALRIRRGRIIKQALGTSGYWQVRFSRDGVATNQVVHRLVAAAFIGPCPPGLDVRHGVAGKLVNRASNLSYGTRAENMHDCIRDGTRRSGAGHQSTNGKLTWEDVADIRRRFAEGERQCDLAREYDLKYGAVYKIVRGHRWVRRYDQPEAS